VNIPVRRSQEWQLLQTKAFMADPLTICIVEDDTAVRESLRDLLEADGLQVQDYPSALEYLADAELEIRSCDCLILDLHMPGMNGIELLELLKARRFSRPVIIVTGRSDSALKDRARKAGAVAVMDKPVDGDVLVDIIRRSVSRH
jgi:FixJ family two-component response regulator